MNSIKLGMKLWSTNSDLYPDLVHYYKEGKIDYLELTYIPGNIENLEILIENKIPIVIHSPILRQGICFSDKKFEKNKKTFQELLDFSNKLNAQGIIIHPSFGKNENFIKFLKENQHSKIIIENMPKTGLNNELAIGYNPEQIKSFLELGPFNFCLDFGHAIKAAISLDIDYKSYIKKFMTLNPTMFHLCGGKMNNEKDEHLDLDNNEFDLQFIKSLIENTNKKITFEVPKTNRLDNDLRNIEYFRKLI